MCCTEARIPECQKQKGKVVYVIVGAQHRSAKLRMKEGVFVKGNCSQTMIGWC